AKELERAFFLSYKHMAAVFKKSRAQTMHEYHQHLRMEEGARLLRETLLPVGEISEQLGFADQLYFSRCFHGFAGVSPTEYRRQVRDY
ncbi:MAG: helix-turn-helix transcriptional regulator, partial [Clostridiales bacterium]|nr:helix-turn-helix transcriptional regulator [Clostridiales bacterium]